MSTHKFNIGDLIKAKDGTHAGKILNVRAAKLGGIEYCIDYNQIVTPEWWWGEFVDEEYYKVINYNNIWTNCL
jgi:hypothetical protein